MKTIPLRFGNSIKRSRFRRSLFLIPLALACFELLPKIHAVSPPPEGSYPNQNTAEGDDALFNLTTGADNRAMGCDALYSNTTGSDDAPASWIWRATGSLNTARRSHTATLLQNGMVLIAGGVDITGFSFASAELYDPARGTWTVTGRLNRERYGHTATLLQNGMVVVAGGLDTNDRVLARAELGYGHR